MNWIFSRFSDETVKIESACRRKFDNHMSEIGDALVYQLFNSGSNQAYIVALTLSAKRIACCRFHPETGNAKYPDNPVNPVYFKN